MTVAIRREFERCRGWLEAALAVDAEDTSDTLLTELLAGRAQLWAGDEACVVTQCVITSEGTTIHAWCGGGRLQGMLALRPGIEAWGRVMGATWATIESRRAWDRLYGPFGYERHGETLRKKL